MMRLAEIMHINSKSTISEILAQRQNIQPRAWDLFREHFKPFLKGRTEKSVYDEGEGVLAIVHSDVEKQIGLLTERAIKAEASITVLTVTLAEILAKTTRRSIGSISVELRKAIGAEADRLFAELQKK